MYTRHAGFIGKGRRSHGSGHGDEKDSNQSGLGRCTSTLKSHSIKSHAIFFIPMYLKRTAPFPTRLFDDRTLMIEDRGKMTGFGQAVEKGDSLTQPFHKANKLIVIISLSTKHRLF
ncbi:hypothetical protein LGM65_15605 [Burkholderia anthina]|uniref:hypothetical protein n=1 Tax=Burkholderia anthina TaxID=179879 RepID=UPI001CF1705F|nr:hypothetical protein [Burkholderia anthina]MCA8092298.1 hypothetical protein [Burkholderia anthina]